MSVRPIVRLAATALPRLYAAWMDFVWRTSRVEAAGLGDVRALLAGEGGCVALLFHEDALLAAWTCRRLGLRPATLVSTSDEENAVERSMPVVTMPTCAVCPTRPAATKRGQSSRRGSAFAMCRR